MAVRTYPASARAFENEPVFARMFPAAGVPFIRFAKVPSPADGNVSRNRPRSRSSWKTCDRTLTIALGVLFTSIQAYEYGHIIEHKYFFSEEAANAGLYGSSFFMATGFHGFHVLIGTIFLIVCLARLMGGGFTPQKHFGFEAAAWYWHFVDVVWLFLFTFIYVIFGAGWGQGG